MLNPEASRNPVLKPKTWGYFLAVQAGEELLPAEVERLLIDAFKMAEDSLGVVSFEIGAMGEIDVDTKN